MNDELLLGDHVLRLDGNVLEVLHRSGTSFRAHVAHVAVEAKVKGDELRLRIGVAGGGDTIVGGDRVRVPAAQQAAAVALIEEARRRRDALGG